MFLAEATRYTNPIKRKYRQKRLAAEGEYPSRLLRDAC